MSRVWGLVAAPTKVCGVRPYWMLRQLAQPARHRPCELVRSPCHPQLRARRRLVLELPHPRLHARAPPGASAASSPRPTRTWASWASPRQLARALGGVVTAPCIATAFAPHRRRSAYRSVSVRRSSPSLSGRRHRRCRRVEHRRHERAIVRARGWRRTEGFPEWERNRRCEPAGQTVSALATGRFWESRPRPKFTLSRP